MSRPGVKWSEVVNGTNLRAQIFRNFFMRCAKNFGFIEFVNFTFLHFVIERGSFAVCGEWHSTANRKAHLLVRFFRKSGWEWLS